MKNIFRNFNIKKIELPRLEKYADILFSLAFVAVTVFLGLIFYNQFLPIYNFDAFKSPKVITGGRIKDEKLNIIIKDLDNRREKIGNYVIENPIKDPFFGAVK